MNEPTTVDVRGLSCPEPAMRVRRALGRVEHGTVTVLLDSVTSRDIVARLSEAAGWRVATSERPDGCFHMVLTR
jgi:TusA-related sulfurtransferase